MFPLRIFLFLAFGMLSPLKSSGTESYVSQGYFGERLEATAIRTESANRGYLLFLRNWQVPASLARNANSCVSCHNTPMPGGSGLYPSTLVAVDVKARKTDGTELLQRNAVGIDSSPQEFRRTPQLFGVGVLEASSHRHLKFGAYGHTDSLETFVSNAFARELGVSTHHSCARAVGQNSYPSRCYVRASDQDIIDVAEYIRSLAPPPRRTTEDVSEGAIIFAQIGCESCHSHRLDLDREDVRRDAYTDLILHNICGNCSTAIRTPALWGLTSEGPPYLHDASATTLVEAILKHSGEAESARRSFVNLGPEQLNRLLGFLHSL